MVTPSTWEGANQVPLSSAHPIVIAYLLSTLIIIHHLVPRLKTASLSSASVFRTVSCNMIVFTLEVDANN